LLTSNDLDKFDVHLDQDLIFRILSEKQHTKALRYIIFELNIDFTDIMKECLEYMTSPMKMEISKMFELRNLKQDLNNELSNEHHTAKRNKV
jgi:hypothetical protein